MAVWNPTTYLAFATERSRPFLDLVDRVRPEKPPEVAVDLGCGPGELTAGLADRWSTAEVLGIDSSPEMIEKSWPPIRGSLASHAMSSSRRRSTRPAISTT
jgi:trans-aconitate 2-methyltransferase